jgi:hypothetical protein
MCIAPSADGFWNIGFCSSSRFVPIVAESAAFVFTAPKNLETAMICATCQNLCPLMKPHSQVTAILRPPDLLGADAILAVQVRPPHGSPSV